MSSLVPMLQRFLGLAAMLVFSAFCGVSETSITVMVRGKLQETLIQAGEDPYHLADKSGAERLLSQYMDEAIAQSPVFGGYTLAARFALPWPRTFEASVSVQSLAKKGEGGESHG